MKTLYFFVLMALGYAPQFHPLKRVLDEFWGYFAGSHDYFTSQLEHETY